MTDKADMLRLFQETILEAFALELSPETATQFCWALSRVGAQNHSDLTAAVTLACFERRAESRQPLTDKDVRRAIWQVLKQVSRQATRSAAIDPGRVHAPPAVPQPIEKAAEHDEIERAKAAVATLPPIDQAIIARRLDGVSAAEIAKEFGLKAAAVRQRIHRSFAQLREAFKSTRAAPSVPPVSPPSS
jgi:RNA polymerase sigma factor (sigma-70 family)